MHIVARRVPQRPIAQTAALVFEALLDSENDCIGAGSMSLVRDKTPRTSLDRLGISARVTARLSGAHAASRARGSATAGVRERVRGEGYGDETKSSKRYGNARRRGRGGIGAGPGSAGMRIRGCAARHRLGDVQGERPDGHARPPRTSWHRRVRRKGRMHSIAPLRWAAERSGALEIMAIRGR